MNNEKWPTVVVVCIYRIQNEYALNMCYIFIAFDSERTFLQLPSTLLFHFEAYEFRIPNSEFNVNLNYSNRNSDNFSIIVFDLAVGFCLFVCSQTFYRADAQGMLPTLCN